MKKTIFLGLTTFALAVMPVVGVFAVDPVTDNISITVDEVCTFTRTASSTGDGSYTKELAANAVDLNFATSTFTAVCNSTNGYTVSATFTALKKGTTATANDIAYSATTPSAGTGTWTAAKGTSSSTTNIAASSGVLMDTSGPDTSSGTVQQVTYKVSTHTAMAQGSYVGTATYALTQK